MDLIQALQLIGITIAAIGGLLTILRGTRELHRPRGQGFVGLTLDASGSLEGWVQAELFNSGNRFYLTSLLFFMDLPGPPRGRRARVKAVAMWLLSWTRPAPFDLSRTFFGVSRGEDLPKWVEHGESYRHFEQIAAIADKADSVLAGMGSGKRAHEVMRHMRIVFVDGYGHQHEARLAEAARVNLNRWLDHRAMFSAATRSGP